MIRQEVEPVSIFENLSSAGETEAGMPENGCRCCLISAPYGSNHDFECVLLATDNQHLLLFYFLYVHFLFCSSSLLFVHKLCIIAD